MADEKGKLPDDVSDQVTAVLKAMELEESNALGAAPIVLESEGPLWYIAYKTAI